MIHKTAVAVIASLSLLVGCKGPGDRMVRPLPDPNEPVAEVDVHELRLFNGMNGSPMQWEDLVRAAGEADVVLIGERHGHPIGLATALRLWEQVAAAQPDAALSMEFFERDEQVSLDDYLTGVTEKEPEFWAAADRFASNYPPGHRAMVETARANGQPVIAANAPRRYVTKARLDGFDSLRQLSAEQQRLFVVPESLTGGRYREKFFEMMGDHGEGSPNPNAPPVDGEGYYRAQNMWDATMADSILSAVAQGRHPVVHVVGQMHCDYSGGTVSRIADQRSDVLLWTISMVNDWSDTLREEDEGRADCVIYVGPDSEKRMR
ncbi:MAG: ChaN family lipoprotein [Phycisphaerales bacterium]|nr:ChaN family lipoprotein [Phycisphaerales bacterium]